VPGGGNLELLYDSIALGMRIYAHSAFRVVVVRPERLRMEQGLLVVATHRSDADVPVICSELYFGADRMYLRHRLRLHFAARDDLFVPGVLAGLLPPTIPLALRRALYRVDASPYLPRVRVHPIRAGDAMKVVQALRHDPAARLEDKLPTALAATFGGAAHAAGLDPPVAAVDVDRAEFAHLLWRDVRLEDLPRQSELWRRRAHEAAGDLRRLVAVIRAGEPLLLFPEGQPSPDGAIGPGRRGLGLLVRRGQPRTLLPLALAYDHLTLGRPRVVVSVGERFTPPTRDVEEVVVERLRATMPLTCGQVVAACLFRATESGEEAVATAVIDRELAAAVEESGASGRAMDPALATTSSRRRRLTECLSALVRSRLLERRDAATLLLDHARLVEHDHVRRAATEYASMLAQVAIR
jgi:1-acyl-sn-glycerol-3-phosphate acyltransferase